MTHGGDLGDIARGHWSQYSDSGCQVYLSPDIWERFEWGSFKRGAFHFSHWLIMERSQNWSGLGSPISKFQDIYFIDTGTDINRWTFQGDWAFGVAIKSIQTLSEVRSLDVTWWPDLEWPGSEIFTICAERMYQQVYQKMVVLCAAVFFFFLDICEKTWGGVQTPPPSPARTEKLLPSNRIGLLGI